MSSLRIRRSIAELELLYTTGQDPSLLENVIRAFRGIMDKDPEDPDSFFMLAGFHGEPFRGKGAETSEWWGGYCHHDDVLFPTWHRAYLLRFENALRSIPGCQDVALPFWDELLTCGDGTGTPIPSVLTTPTFPLDGRDDNPLYSYKLQRKMGPKLKEQRGVGERYTKHEGYETVRFPLSGLVGTEEARVKTEAYNFTHGDQTKRTALLNENVANWLEGSIQITKEEKFDMPDLYSVAKRYKLCLDAPNYTVFSNVESQNAWIKEHVAKCHKVPSEPGDQHLHYVVSLESPHNAIHLAVGGFYQAPYTDKTIKPPKSEKDGYKTSDFVEANGEMGCNETAGFDPIFYLHHCFVDYVFWVWQKRHGCTRPGSLEVIAEYKGATNKVGLPDIDPETPLDMQTPLHPFTKQPVTPGQPAEQQVYYVSDDVVDIGEQLGYSYGPASLDAWMRKPRAAPHTALRLADDDKAPAIITGFKHVHAVDRAEFPGSFVLRMFARVGAAKEKVEIGREAVLSRWNIAGCANCQAHLKTELLVPMSAPLETALRAQGGGAEVEYDFEIQTALDGTLGSLEVKGEDEHPAGRPGRSWFSVPGPRPHKARKRGILEDLVPGN